GARMVPCSTIHRPPARCHHRSAPCMTVKPKDQNVRPAARYHVAAVSRSEPRPHDAIPAFAVEAGDGGRARLPAALGTLPRLNRRPSARAGAREAGGGGASQFAATMTAARLAREPGTHTPRCAPRDAYGSALYARAVSARNQARLWPSSIQVSRRLAVATSP